MKILVIGQGGREHAICWKLQQSNKVTALYCAPGNGGIAAIAKCVEIKETDFEALAAFVEQEKIDLTVVGPENPLVEGIVDFFQAKGLKVYGPSKAAAMLEGSKAFAKEIMLKYGVPTAAYARFTEAAEALAYLDKQKAPIVIKADGLAAGKGVVVAQTITEAKAAVQDMLQDGKFGTAGSQVIIEEFLSGEELSLMAFVDGETVIPMVPAQDHKPVYDNDKGPNTGGMGTYSPVPQFDQAQVDRAVQDILLPVAKAMVAEGKPFQGVLYAGLMMTAAGPKVIEFNTRFGDPETQVVLPRLATDLVDIFLATVEHRLDQLEVSWKDQAVVSVILASPGYPESYPKGLAIHGLDPATAQIMQQDNQFASTLSAEELQQIMIFHAGTKMIENSLVTSGGRVLAVTGQGDTLEQARERAYAAVNQVNFQDMHYRKDIALKAFK